MAKLVDCIDELDRVVSRMRLLEHVLIHTNAAEEDRYRGAVAQQAQDVSEDLDKVVEALNALLKAKPHDAPPECEA